MLLLYLDNIIAISPDFRTHLHQLQELFLWLKETWLKLKSAKCELFQSQVPYLGQKISKERTGSDNKKTKIV